MRHAEVVHRASQRIGSLLLADDHDAASLQFCRAGDDRSIVAVQAVSAQLAPAGENALDHLVSARPIRMSCERHAREGSVLALSGLRRRRHAELA